MTDKLNEWRETMRRATERPWKSDGVDVFNLTDGAGQGFPLDRYPDSVDVVVGQCERCGTYEVGASPENLAAIACAVNNFEALMDECERLATCLAKANSNHEEFERRWYLEQDAADACRTKLAAVLAAKDEACEIALQWAARLRDLHGDPQDRERIAALRAVGK